MFVVLFEDNPEADGDTRCRLMSDHLAFLDRHAENIRAAGPLGTAEGEPAGGLWLVEAAAATDVEALVKGDPFWPTGLRKSVRILAWTQVYADGKRVIAG